MLIESSWCGWLPIAAALLDVLNTDSGKHVLRNQTGGQIEFP
jgi:hypothetical protein